MRKLHNQTLSRFLATPGRFAIYGTGATGQAVLRRLAECGLKPAAFLDSHRTGELLGLEILPPEEALGLDAVITAGRGARDMTVQLRADGFEGPVLDLTGAHRETEGGHHDERPLDEAADAIAFARSLLREDGAREIFDAVLRYRRSLDPGELPPAPPAAGHPAVPIREGEWLLAVGLGPTAIADRAGSVGPRGRVHVLEPDPARRQAVTDLAETEAFGARLVIHPLECGAARPRSAGEGDRDAPRVVTVDEFVWEETSGRVDRLEVGRGGAAEILDGASATLAEHRPRIAVCVGRAPSDLWEIPIRVKERFPSYRLHLGHHSQNLAGTRCYGRPSEA